MEAYKQSSGILHIIKSLQPLSRRKVLHHTQTSLSHFKQKKRTHQLLQTQK
ncbi:hypothetical protein HOLleu_15788 [Holothuria leucospilota]|uniref:Uncharacterized protein n=1 Tax=Holothuria leucospilota TaxID=206669 RepID=A0A9Q1C534_HOLLE|nr:hypothetical protein HOLleu_15788 [Holothuria leucospilota]